MSPSLYSNIKSCVSPEGSLLEKYGSVADYHDCFQLKTSRKTTATAEQPLSAKLFADAFFSSSHFRPEAWLLSMVTMFYKPPSSEFSYASGIFRVIESNDREIVLDTGGTQSWLCVQPSPAGDNDDTSEIVYQFGSIVNKSDWLVRLLIYPHTLYAKYLLVGAVQQHQQENRNKSH
mmetsp:Transcript_22777/g.38759  ORF Transcript_22777/g.38759 Transcript_22777/m.38759 type:complete len:176 (-) Transcript_22777:42-569(-)